MRTRDFYYFNLFFFSINRQKLTFTPEMVSHLLLIGLIAAGAAQFDRSRRRSEHLSSNL